MAKKIKATPSFLLSNDPPSIEKIKSLAKPKNEKLVTYVEMFSDGIKAEAVSLLKAIPNKGEIFFLGNGMHPFATVLSPLSNRIRELPLSRMSFSQKDMEVNFFKYLDQQKIQLQATDPITLIDSLGQPKGEHHSLLRVQKKIIEYLITKGVSAEKAQARVKVIGIPENSRINPALQIPQITSLGRASVYAINFPSWHGTGRKFIGFDTNGNPLREYNVMENLSQKELNDDMVSIRFNNLINERLEYLWMMQQLSKLSKKISQDKETQAILRNWTK